MTEIITVLALVCTMITCGLGFRIRGGLWNTWIEKRVHWGATTARIVAWAMLISLWSVYWYSLAWPWAVAVGVAAWLGCILGWYGGIDMGRHMGTWWKDFVTMTWRGALWCVPLAVVFGWLGFMHTAIALVIVGILMGVWYELGWRTPTWRSGFEQGTEWGEFYFGVMFAVTFALTAIMFPLPLR